MDQSLKRSSQNIGFEDPNANLEINEDGIIYLPHGGYITLPIDKGSQLGTTFNSIKISLVNLADIDYVYIALFGDNPISFHCSLVDKINCVVNGETHHLFNLKGSDGTGRLILEPVYNNVEVEQVAENTNVEA